MTAAKKNNSRRKSAKFRRSRKKRIQKTILLVLLLIFLGGAGIGSIYLLRNGTLFGKLDEPYMASREFSGGITGTDSLRADGFAKKLVWWFRMFLWMGFPLERTRKGFFWIWMTGRCFIPNRHLRRYIQPVSPRS